MNSKSKFSRYNGRATFACTCCGRSTRDTDQGGTDLCMQCFELAGMDNHFNDSGTTPTLEEYKDAMKYVAQIKAKGGDAQRAMLLNSYLFTDANKESETVTDEKTPDEPVVEPTVTEEPAAKPKGKVKAAKPATVAKPKGKVKAAKPATASAAKPKGKGRAAPAAPAAKGKGSAAKPATGKAKGKGKAKGDGQRYRLAIGRGQGMFVMLATVQQGKLTAVQACADPKTAIVYDDKASAVEVRVALRKMFRTKLVTV